MPVASVWPDTSFIPTGLKRKRNIKALRSCRTSVKMLLRNAVNNTNPLLITTLLMWQNTYHLVLKQLFVNPHQEQEMYDHINLQMMRPAGIIRNFLSGNLHMEKENMFNSPISNLYVGRVIFLADSHARQTETHSHLTSSVAVEATTLTSYQSKYIWLITCSVYYLSWSPPPTPPPVINWVLFSTIHYINMDIITIIHSVIVVVSA